MPEPKYIINFIFSLMLLMGTTLLLPTHSLATQEYVFTGQTMGTTYSIKMISAKPLSKSLWQKKINLRLKQVNARLSMYQKNSELSRFNAAPKDQIFRASADFYQVLDQCRHLHTLTDGAWDGTVKPLVDLWGFGTKGRRDTPPEPAEIKAALKQIGFNKLKIGDHVLTKTMSGITLDLGSIAKGYGVDEIARLIREGGIKSYLVEIGGELVGAGENKHRKAWIVGITNPQKGFLNSGLYKEVRLDNKAIATSGNYRNYFEKNGRIYSHIISPKTGYPVKNAVISVSVISDTCTLADGLATALMVMDTHQSLALINSLKNTECLIIRQDGKKRNALRSSGFKSYEIGF
ncbi:FAD:protein FMN transferase [Desulfobacter hydrogenophilus]|uniref:FAD:protein FMN transferase n=1 Tax=Desulfobacter hydrogenophilus TaxID=2291 RepID=A0A328FFN9_9BACT|nr:FAD:protein FMN transferase [Desulfobacter hydrogenophilus]NDY70770.1 FAD:protein FMN transferase [Desulfobacter hydrogenophilus]QBH12621.1 FAD:protein FMN transferase [Desulfobacter hydrogenophilus]RAM03418.1 FAD:protein FMN transferase [Desulfobacter hydrogenophilus]